MSGADPRTALLREVRALLADWQEDGVTHLPQARERPALAPPGDVPGVHAVPARESPAGGGAVPPGGAADPENALTAIRENLGDCRRCGLCESRNQIVFGEGSARSPIVFVGEGPGADEDRTGRPFVGKAGELLTRMIEALGWDRSQVYICNVVKCRPPGNRDPSEVEVRACRPFLERQLLAIHPRVIITLGRPAASTLLERPVAITKLRGQWQEWNGIPVMPTFHPAYLLRNYTRETRMAVWDDLRAARERAEPTSP